MEATPPRPLSELVQPSGLHSYPINSLILTAGGGTNREWPVKSEEAGLSAWLYSGYLKCSNSREASEQGIMGKEVPILL